MQEKNNSVTNLNEKKIDMVIPILTNDNTAIQKLLDNEMLKEKLLELLKNEIQSNDSENQRKNNSIDENKLKETLREKIKEEFETKNREILEKVERRISDKKKEIRILEDKEKTALNQLEEKEIEKRNLEFKFKNLEKKVESLNNEITFLEEEKRGISNEIRKSNEEKKMLGEVSLKLENKIKEKNELERLISDIENQKKEEQKKLERLHTEFQEKQELLIKVHEQEIINSSIEKELERRRSGIEIRENSIKKFEEKIEKEIETRYSNLLELERKEIRKREDLLEEKEHDIFNLNQRLKKYNNYEYDQIVEENENLKSENEKIRKKIAERNGELEKENQELQIKINDYNEKQSEIKALQKEIINFQTDKAEVDLYKLRYESTQNLHRQFEEERTKLLNEIEKLKNTELSKEEKIRSIQENNLIRAVGTIPKDTSEIHWLNNMIDNIRKEGFEFSDRLLWAFHTSLKISDWSPLTVLAGVSGTGKSELPRLYSTYGGLYYLPLAVQPDWDSPQSLFGYYNSLEGKFNATTLLKLLYQFQPGENGDFKEYMSLILLDEMNLAHVELYFSELLSKLELLRGSSNVNLDINISESTPLQIGLGKNILWTGTMNEDETTKSLSDKVIDRGSLLNFPRPTELKSREKILKTDVNKTDKLRNETWESWKYIETNEKLKDDIEEYRKVLEDINGALEISGRAIGHRVWQALESYIKNHPLVVCNLNSDNERKKYVKIAFEDAVVHKVIPKLRGLETSGDVKDKCLDVIKNILIQHADGLVPDFELALDNPYGVFAWRSSKYLNIK